MKVLILSANTGQGHNSCSQAIKEAFEAHGTVCEIKDSLAFMSKGISGFVVKLHVGSYRKAPGLFGWGYKVSEKHPGVFGKGSPLYLFFKRGAKKLAEYIESGNFDIVIACHVFAAVMLTAARKYDERPLKTAFVATDFTASPSIEHSDLDYYFIPDESIEDEFAAGGIDPKKLYASGIPVRGEYFLCTQKEEAKVLAGVNPDKKHLIMMCGSMGCGPMDELADALDARLGRDCEVSIICGLNEKLKKGLTEKFAANRRMHIYGYVDNVSLFMDSADLFLTKAGGISTCEAAAKRLPMVFINAVSGCETYNLNFFVNSGGAVTAEGVSGLSALCARLLSDPAGLSDMSKMLSKVYSQNPAEEIYKVLADS